MKTTKIESVTREYEQTAKKGHRMRREPRDTAGWVADAAPAYVQSLRSVFFRWFCATIGACLACLIPIKYLPSPNVYFILIDFFFSRRKRSEKETVLCFAGIDWEECNGKIKSLITYENYENRPIWLPLLTKRQSARDRNYVATELRLWRARTYMQNTCVAQRITAITSPKKECHTIAECWTSLRSDTKSK